MSANNLCVFDGGNIISNLTPFSIKGLGKYGVLFYNALIIIIPTTLASAFTGDLNKVHEVPEDPIFSLCLYPKLNVFPA